MNKTGFLCLIILLVSGSCAHKEISPLEGTWEWISADYSLDRAAAPTRDEGSIMKFWTKDHFAFIGQLAGETNIEDRYGWGNYELDGNRYTEHVVFHYEDFYQGQSVRMILEIRNDTLIQKWPVNENWQLPDIFNTEFYIRRD
jgi:hypothetical protein